MNDERVPLFYVGHSFGGHALGLLPNHDRIARAYLFAVGAGWHGWMPPLERVRVQVLWNVVLPVLTSCYGYMPSRMLGMGEDLPLGVYRDWRRWCSFPHRRWCSFPHYFFDDPAEPGLADEYGRVRTPIVAGRARAGGDQSRDLRRHRNGDRRRSAGPSVGSRTA
jgi:predicted alpha/beta hydrolase